MIKKPTFDPEYIRDLSEQVYRLELGDEDTRRMIEKDKDQGEKLRGRAVAYDALTRSYLRVLGMLPQEPGHG